MLSIFLFKSNQMNENNDDKDVLDKLRETGNEAFQLSKECNLRVGTNRFNTVMQWGMMIIYRLGLCL